MGSNTRVVVLLYTVHRTPIVHLHFSSPFVFSGTVHYVVFVHFPSLSFTDLYRVVVIRIIEEIVPE